MVLKSDTYKHTQVIGLTGGIGSGKSTVAKFFHELGAPVYIADEEAKKIMETSKEVQQEIKTLLGEEAYRDGMPNRAWIAAKVFKNKELLQRLNAIVHPRVRAHFKTWLGKQTAPYIIYEAAILLESGGEAHCDRIILITAKKETRVARLLKRDRSTREEIEARMAAQWSDEKKLDLADFHIQNESLEHTKERVFSLHTKLLNP